MLPLTAGQPPAPVPETKASAGHWLWELVEEKKASLGCRSERGLGAALDARVSAGKEKAWVSWGGQAWRRATCTLARCSALAWAFRTLGVTPAKSRQGRPGGVRAWAEARYNQTGEGLGQTCRLWPGGQVTDLQRGLQGGAGIGGLRAAQGPWGYLWSRLRKMHLVGRGLQDEEPKGDGDEVGRKPWETWPPAVARWAGRYWVTLVAQLG